MRHFRQTQAGLTRYRLQRSVIDATRNSRYALVICLCTCQGSPQTTHQSSALSQSRLFQSTIDLSGRPASTFSNCMKVGSDGSFHIEERKQVLPKPTNDLKVYEGVLTRKQREELRSLLDQPAIANLPNTAPVKLNGSPYISGFRLEVQRDTLLQKVGYTDWRTPTVSREGATPEEVRIQEQNEKLLAPIVTWFHQLLETNLPDGKSPPDFCGGPFQI